MPLMDLAEPIYADVFQRVLAEHPEYAVGPFRLTISDSDVARVLSHSIEAKRVKLDTVRGMAFPHLAGMRIDELAVMDGCILLVRRPPRARRTQ